MKRTGCVFLLACLSTAASQPAAIDRARQAYNQQHYEVAIAAANEARRVAATADAATLVLARAHLERFRQTEDATDLTAARAALAAIDPARLTARDRADMMIGLAASLYLEKQYGAAADVFDLALGQAELSNLDSRERVLDWWASAVDRFAQASSDATRRRLYEAMLSRLRQEPRRGSESAAASYWIVAATRGAGDLEGAWHAAIATWVRAPLVLGSGRALRVDIDRIVQDAIIPERARQMSPDGDSRQILAIMRGEWEAVKQKWPVR